VLGLWHAGFLGDCTNKLTASPVIYTLIGVVESLAIEVALPI
jgi:uncharacterized membrane protein